MASIHDDFLREIAYKLADGEQFQVICPECAKRGFSLKREAGRLLYHCFKAGCGFSGMVLLRGYASQEHTPSPAQQEERLTPYCGAVVSLTDDCGEALQRRFCISARLLRAHVHTGARCYVLPILDPKACRRGVVIRQPWEGTGSGIPGTPKSQIFKEKHEPMIGWYAPTAHSVVAGPPNAVILVEDQMSAIKLADCGYLACALLGTSLNSEKISEIQSVSKHIVIALDSDATATAFKLARKWQAAFSSCRVVILTSDPKDMTREEIHQKFGS